MTASSLTNNVPALATPFDNGLVNSVIPSPAQLSSGFVPNVDKINAEQQNWLHNAGTTAIWLMQQLGLSLPFNPSAGASLVATPAGGIVSIKNNSTGATEFYIAKNYRAIGYTDPSLDPTNWVLFNITNLAQFAGFFAASGGTSDAITATFTVPYPALVNGYPLTVKIGTPNTTTTPTFAPTLNGAAQTARTIVKYVNNAAVALAVGDLTGNAQLRYDLANTRWILENPKLTEHTALADLATNAVNVIGGGYVNATSVASSGAIQSSSGGITSSHSSAGIGYSIGAGGQVIQLTSKSTSVTLNRPSGQIIMNNSSLASGASVTFSFANTAISPLDILTVFVAGGFATQGSYSVKCDNYGITGINSITLTNNSAGSLAENIIINFLKLTIASS